MIGFLQGSLTIISSPKLDLLLGKMHHKFLSNFLFVDTILL